MCAQMLRLIFCLLTTIFLGVGAQFVGNQDLAEYFSPIKIVDLKWVRPTSEQDFNKTVLKNDALMILLDFAEEGFNSDFKKIVNIFMDIKKHNSEIKNGLVFKFESTEQFQNVLWTPSIYENIEGDLSPYPQWFHINTEIIRDVSEFYVEHIGKYYPYTYSFSYGATENPGINEEFKQNLSNVNYVISNENSMHNLNCDLSKNTLYTMVHNEETHIGCVAESIENAYKTCKDKLLLNMQPNLKIHARICSKNQALLNGDEKATITWRSIQNFSDINRDIKEDIIKVDVDGDLETSYLNQSFETFIKKFATTLPEKGLQFNFKTKAALEAFINMENITFGLFDQMESLKIGIKFEKDLWNEMYKDNPDWKAVNDLSKILSCYSVSLSAENGSGPYKSDDITNLHDIGDKIKQGKIYHCERTKAGSDENIIYSLDLKRVSQSNPEVIEEIKGKMDTAEFSFTETKETVTKDELRDLMRKLGSSEVYFDCQNAEQQKDVLENVLITDLIPELKNDLTILNFELVRTWNELILALEEVNTMLEVYAKGSSCSNGDACEITIGEDIELCKLLEEVGKYNKNGIKINFVNVNHLKGALNNFCFQFLNFPVWLELDLSTGNIDLTNSPDLESYLKKHGYKTILKPKEIHSNDDAEKLILQRNAISSIIDVGFYINAADITEYEDHVNKILDYYHPEIVLAHSSAIEINAKKLRDILKTRSRYYAKMDDKLILEKCPAIESNEISSDKFKNLKIADFTNGDRDTLIQLVELFDMIRVKVSYANKELYVDEAKKNTLSNFLETFDTVVNESSKVGIILTFRENIAYIRAMKTDQMKTYNHPIWFNIKIPSTSKTGEAIDLNYGRYNDKLDCRTLLLEIDAQDKYNEEDIAELTTYSDKGNDRIHAFNWDLIQSMDLLKDVKKVLLQASDDTVLNTEEIRGKLKDLKKSDVAIDFSGSRKFASRDCPKNNDVFNYFTELDKEDLSDFTLSNYITSLNNIQSAIADGNHMLNTLLTTQGSTVIVNKDLSLLQLLKNIASLPSDKKIGLKLEFETTESFVAAVNDPFILYYIKTLERPIWISAKVIGDKNVELNHPMNNDILDCRTLSLGWTGSGNSKYSKENLEAMKNLPMGTNNKLYNVDMIHLVKNFENIKKILLTKPSSTPGRTKPLKEEATELNGNKLMVSITQNEISKLEVAGLNELLNEYKEILFFDMTFEVKKQVFSGAKSLNSGLFMILALSLGLMMINH